MSERRTTKHGLLPCPFCDSLDLRAVNLKDGMVVMVVCTRCQMTGPIAISRTIHPNESEDESLSRVLTCWNTRNGIEPQTEGDSDE